MSSLLILVRDLSFVTAILLVGWVTLFLIGGTPTGENIALIAFISAAAWFTGSFLSLIGYQDAVAGPVSHLFNAVGAFCSGAAVLFPYQKTMIQTLSDLLSK